MEDNVAATIDQNINPNPFASWVEIEPNIPGWFEQNRETSDKLWHESALGITPKVFPKPKPSEPFYAFAQNEHDRAFYPLSLLTESPAANRTLVHTHKNTNRYLQRGRLLKYLAEASQPIGDKAFQLSSWVVESPSTDKNWKHSYRNTVLDELSKRFNVIAQRKDDWDGYDSKSPNESSLDNARQFMNEFVDAIFSGGDVPLTPLSISSDEDGHITVEWHGEDRQLHLQIEEKEVDYIQVWGPNIDTEMHVDTLHSKEYLTLWKWFIYGK